MAVQTIERKSELSFPKWDTVGMELDVVITEAAVKGKVNQFGGVDNYFRGVITGTEDKVQVSMPYDLLKKFEQVEESIVLGQTRFVIKYESKRMLPPGADGKARQFKTFSVGVEGLKDE